MKRRGKVLLAVGLAMVTCAATLLAVVLRSESGWRLRILASKADGGFPEFSWTEMAKIARPGSGFWVDPFTEYGLHVPLTSNFDSPGELQQAESEFRQKCSACHGADASGTNHGPALRDIYLARARDDLATYRVIVQGIGGTTMPPHSLAWDERWRLVAFIRSIKGSEDATAIPIPGIDVNVSASDIAAASTTPEDWLTYSGTYDGQRYSRLAQIDRRNVTRLHARWIHQLPEAGDTTRQQTVPLVRNGIMYMTAAPSTVIAADAATGKQLWKFQHRVPQDIDLCCGVTNRGVAILGDQVFIATLDARLIALDAASGKVNWNREIADYRQSYSSTAAPLAVNDLIVTGVGGGDYTTRGFIAAYRAADGEQVWRFETIPGPGSPGHETWSGDSWKAGGAATWMTGSFDPSSNTIYWGVGNPTPEYMGSYREGDNLYSESVVALDAASGKLRWHFQFTPHDVHGWDSCQIPILIDRPSATGTSKLLAFPNRNGFYYALDAASGRFLAGRAFATQSWAEGLDTNGRPISKGNSAPSEQGTLVWPGSTGATNWWPSAFSPQTSLLYVPVLERSSIFFTGNEHEPTEGQTFGGSAVQQLTGRPFHTAIRALHPDTGELAWEHRWGDRASNDIPRIGGLLATAGGLVFAPDESRINAMDARTGEVLWSFDVGANINTAPSTYSAGGEQFLVVAAGKILMAFALPR